MSHLERWRETRDVLAALPYAVDPAIVVIAAVEGSAYRRPGAKLLLDQGRMVTGVVSGGCLEEDIVVHAGHLSAAQGVVLRYDTSSGAGSAFGIPMGCDARLTILVVRPSATQREHLQSVLQRLEQGQALDLMIAVNVDRSATVDAATVSPGLPRLLETDDAIGLIEPLRPPPGLTVFGGGAEASSIAALAQRLGFRLQVVEHREQRRQPMGIGVLRIGPREPAPMLDLGPDDFAILKMHHEQLDEAWLARLVQSQVGYIGVMGPRRRTERLLASIGCVGDGRIFAPVGLDLGAEGPEQMAVSIVSEILAVHSRRTGTHLRHRTAASSLV